MISCTSQSGKRIKEAPVKVVILEGKLLSSGQLKYKVKVIDHSVVGYIYSLHGYNDNDTILSKPSKIYY